MSVDTAERLFERDRRAAPPQPGASPTFLFCDIVGWTALTAEHGDDHGADLAIGLRRCAAALAPAHAAKEVKALGDGLLLRGLDAAAGIALGIILVERAAVPLRVGIHTGPAVVRDGDWYGTTVNVASRLCAIAASGEVLVSEATLRAAGGWPRRRCSQRRLYRLRNLRDPVAACVVRA